VKLGHLLILFFLLFGFLVLFTLVSPLVGPLLLPGTAVPVFLLDLDGFGEVEADDCCNNCELHHYLKIYAFFDYINLDFLALKYYIHKRLLTDYNCS